MKAELVLIDSVEEVEAFLRWLGERRPILGFDVETTGLDMDRDHIRLAQFGDGETGWAMAYADWRGLVRHVLERYDRPLVAHNVSFDVGLAEIDGLTAARHRFHDTMPMCHLHDSHGPKGLKPASVRYVDRQAMTGERELKDAMAKNRWTWATVPVDFPPYWQYGALDPVLTCKLADYLWPRIQYAREAYELELAVTWELLDVERRGVRIDRKYCERQVTRLRSALATVEERWPGMNLHSTDQVVTELQRRDHAFTKRTPKGNLAIDEEVLAKIDDPLARDTLEARSHLKPVSGYFEPFLRLAIDDVLHPSINPLGAEKTGRMSIARPGMQTLPRTKLVRDAVIPQEGNRLVLSDYQAQETRLIAHFSGDKTLTDIFRRGDDVHTIVASMIYGIPVEEVTPELRRRSKQSGHARNYGSAPAKLALVSGASLGESTRFAQRYDRTFPGIGEFNRRGTRIVRERGVNDWGYVLSLSGRRIMVPLRKAYVWVNYLIQGSGSDVIKRGIVNAARLGIGEFLVLPVHDELLWDVPVEDLDAVERVIHEAMELDDLRVPLPVETKRVNRWGDAYA